MECWTHGSVCYSLRLVVEFDEKRGKRSQQLMGRCCVCTSGEWDGHQGTIGPVSKRFRAE